MVRFTVNRQAVNVAAAGDKPLLWVLRDELGMKGTKYGCGVGVCGICLVLIDGEPQHACMVPLAKLARRSVITVEGLQASHPALIDAWVADQVPQCGYCQGGQLIAAAALFDRVPAPCDAEIDMAMSGVLCRCGTYARIRRAIRRIAAKDGLPVAAPSSVSVVADAGKATMLSDFIGILPDGRVLLMLNHSEMGQGALTGLAMLIAEELELSLPHLAIAFAPADRRYRNPLWGAQFTGGSSSIRGEWEPYRRYAAATRERLLAAAARRWHVRPQDCRADDGAVVHRASGRRVGFTALAAEAAKIPEPASPPLKARAAFRVIGRSAARLEIPDMVAGRTVYGIDASLPGTLAASVVHCPVFGGRLKRLDDSAARAVPGVRDVVAIEAGVAVVADDFWSALQGRERLAIEWQEGRHAALNNAAIDADLARAARHPGKVVRDGGRAAQAPAVAARVIEAEYSTPYLAHATLEPMNCTASVRRDGVNVWVGTQSQVDTQKVAAKVARCARSAVTVHTRFLGGGFGRRLETDFVAEAVELSRTIARPVQLTWTRGDDLQHDRYRPAGAAYLRAALSEDGRPAVWLMRFAGPQLALDGIHLDYAIGNVREEHVEVASAVPTGPWRSVGASQNAFAIESFIDELAHAAGCDPFDYRRALLAHEPRLAAVLERVAAMAGWGRPIAPGTGLGIACYRSFGSRVAIVVEAQVDSSRIAVPQVWAAIDCGIAVNPDAVRAQVEGSIAMGLSAALKEELRIEQGRVTQATFEDYPILMFAEMPDVEIHIMDGPDDVGGAGEPGLPPVAPALANAVFAACGRRLRRLPLRLAS